MKKKILVTAIALAVAIGAVALLTPTPAEAARGTCANVRCASCPDGYHLRMQWPYCCQCVPN